MHGDELTSHCLLCDDGVEIGPAVLTTRTARTVGVYRPEIIAVSLVLQAQLTPRYQRATESLRGKMKEKNNKNTQ